MSDSELIAYLDGEADPATARLLEVRLASEPEVRQQLLTLMRQRVALTRVLMGVAPVALPPRSTQRWWLLAAAGLAAAGIMLAIAVVRPDSPTAAPSRIEQATVPGTVPRGPVAPPDVPTQAPPAPPAPPLQRDPVPAPEVRLADGMVLLPGTVIEAGPDQPLERRLRDGTVFTLAASSALEVPAAGGLWRLRRGSVTCAPPTGARAAIATTQALVEADGRILLSMTSDGTQLRLLAGEASTRDALTAETTRLRVGVEAWIPVDDTAPRNDEVSAGVARGTVVEVGPQGRSLVLRTRFGTVSFVPEWLVQPPGHDPAMCARLARLSPGDRVAITWRSHEHLRVQDVRVITAAPRQEEPPPPALDF